jgi:hypothetical protein
MSYHDFFAVTLLNYHDSILLNHHDRFETILTTKCINFDDIGPQKLIIF